MSATSSPSVSGDLSADHNGVGDFVQNLNSQQYQQLMAMLTHHLASFSPGSNAPVASSSNSAGICLSTSFQSLSMTEHRWIVDTGATRHVC